LEDFGSAQSFLRTCAEGWYAQQEAPEGSRAEYLTNNIRTFYAYLFWGNIAKQREVREEYFIEAGTAWGEVFQYLEAQFENILRRHLACSEHDDVWSRSEDLLRQLEVSDKEIGYIRRNAAQTVMALAKKDPNFMWSLPDGINETLEIYTKRLGAFRNKMVHAQQAILYLHVFPTPQRPHDGWTIDAIVSITADLIRLGNGCNDSLNRTPPP
jgi:hypothetical protein